MRSDWSGVPHSRAFFDWVLPLLLFASVIARIVLTLHREFNVDEFQHLHASWMLHLGFLPYKDFWENHAPLLYFLTAPVLSFLGESARSLLIVRAIHSF